MAWNDFEVTTVAVPRGGSNVRPIITDVKVFDGITGLPVQLRQDGASVNTITPDASGRAVFQALDSLVVRVEALGWSELVESVQQKQAKGTFTGDLETATDAAVDRAEADGRLLNPDVAAATYATKTTVAGKVDKGALAVNVKDHGATGNGTADDTDAILAAQTAAGARPLFFPIGNYRFSATLTAQNIVGENRQRTILTYTGTGSAVGVPTSGVQSYHRRVENLTITGQGSGTGLDLNAVASGMFRNLMIKGFTQCVWMRAPAGGQCLYNVFVDVTVDQCTTGYRFDNISNENKFYACRVNGATARGVDIRSGGHNVFDGGAIENAATGFYVEEPGGNIARANVVSNTRFEFCTNNIYINTGAAMTLDIGNREIGGAHVDNGTGTIRVDVNTGAVSPGRYTTATRPAASTVTAGGMIYDTTLGRPVWSNGSAWRDATGAAV